MTPVELKSSVTDHLLTILKDATLDVFARIRAAELLLENN